MADKEDESNMTAGAREGECSSAAPLHSVAVLAHSQDPVVPENMHNTNSNGEELTLVVKDTSENPVIPEYFQGSVQEGAVLGQDGQVVSPFAGDGLLSDRNIITSFVETTGIETVSVNSDLAGSSSPATTTIIYVQPDGSFVEGTGLTAEEQRQLVEQLAQQQLVEVTENEAARLFQQQRPPTSHFAGALAPSELQQVIDQVSRSQQAAAQGEPHSLPPPAQRPEPAQPVSEQPPACISLPPGCVLAAGSPAQDAAVRPPPLCIVQNASQQLQNVAKQVALQQSQSHNGTRLVQKKVETIRIQVPVPSPQQEAKPCPAPALALLQQRAPPAGPTPKVGVSTPQIIHITPVIGQQQYLLANPGDPPIQLLLQRPAPLVGGAIPVPLQTAVNGRASRPAPSRGPAPAPPPSGPPRPPQQKEQREKQRPRRPLKVQTRSGRVSRPPKHKVKDYKFIKTEDLADGRQSDSDDYSEISLEEEAQGAPDTPAAVGVYLTSKTFKCRSCDKAYIGLGGLTRHYRLNPSHGEAEPAALTPPTRPSAALAPPPGSKTDTPTGPAPTAARTAHCPSTSASQITPNSSEPVPTATSEPVPTATSDVALATEQREKVDLLPLQGALAPSGPGRPKGRAGGPRPAARPVRRRRPGRPPKSLGALLPHQRRVRLKEMLQVCDDEDLMETVLPRLARVMTLWEFLLIKVDKGHPSRPQFSDVYREFELLHAQVKKMAQEHFSGSQDSGPHTVLDVQDPQVCQSLGIADLLSRLQTPPCEKPAQLQPSESPTLREDCKAGPPAKRFKTDPSASEPNGTFQNRTSPQAAGPVQLVPLLHRCVETRSQPPESSPTQALGYQSTELPLHPQNTPELPPPQMETSSSTGPTGSAPSPTPGVEPGQGAELNGCDMADQMEQVVGSDVVPLDHTYRASNQTEHAQTHTYTVSSQTEHAQTHAVIEQTEHAQQAVCLGATCQQTLGEQVFIQTAEGLILPGGVLSSERIVIVTSPDGTTMHIRGPDSVPLETVPLETVQALIGMDTGAQSEGLLVSENHP